MRLLDLFCKAGGAGMGYRMAGFDVVGVDIEPQPNYPFEFHQADALEYVKSHWQEFDAIHASPPCQAYTMAKRCTSNDNHPELVAPTREILEQIGLPYVIENVPGAPLLNPITLCGAMFEDLRTYRHRLFETNFYVPQPKHPEHVIPQVKMGRSPKNGEFIQVVGHFSGVKYAQQAMRIDWMNRDELAQAIPPAYTTYIGRYVMAELRRVSIAA